MTTKLYSEIAVCSMFRDSQQIDDRLIKQADRFFLQMESQSPPVGRPHYYLVEGNSIDDTWETLRWYQAYLGDRVSVYKHEVEGSEVSSIESKTRFQNLSACANVVLNAAKEAGHKWILWVESDIILSSGLIENLFEFLHRKASELNLNEDDFLGVAPLPLFANDQFYDTLCFVDVNGHKWNNSDGPALKNTPVLQLKSFGTCALLNADNLRKHNIDFGENCFMELCRRGHEVGLKMFCDTSNVILHPSQVNLGGRLV